MKLLETKEGVVNFFLYNGEEIFVDNEKIVIEGKEFPVGIDPYYGSNAKYGCEGDVLYKYIHDENDVRIFFRFDGNSFVEENFRYKSKKYYNSQQFSSISSIDGNIQISLMDKGTERLIDFTSEDKYFVLTYDIPNEVLVLIEWYDESLLFYTKTGERLWEYTVKEGYEILEGAIVVVDDVVVITCKDEKGRLASAEGYNLLTGEKLWEITDRKCLDRAYTMGPDKMLYALTTVLCEDHTHELQLDRLNPFTGEVEVTVIEKGEYWTEIWPWNTTIYGNKLFYTNLLRSKGPSFGVIDLDTKKIIEDIPLNVIGYQIETPIVTDEKIYVRVKDLNELRIYENEYK